MRKKIHAKIGQKVRKGLLLFEADLDAIRAAGLHTITPVLICNADNFTSVKGQTGNAVTNADLIIVLSK